MKMYVGTEWSDRPRTVPVITPFDGSQIDTVPRGNADDVDIAIATTTRGAEEMARLPGYERYLILRRAGLKDSGMGKEGPSYAVQEMTELKMVVFH